MTKIQRQLHYSFKLLRIVKKKVYDIMFVKKVKERKEYLD